MSQQTLQRQRTDLLEESQQVEVALRQSEAKFRRFAESNVLGVYVADFNGAIFEANDAFLEMVGYTQDDLSANQMNWANMTPPQYVQLDQQAIAEQKTQGVCSAFEKEYYRKDGSRVPVLFGCAVFDAEQQRSIGFVLDLSDRKRAEAASVLEERNRIAREIHDTLAQAFTSIIVHLDVATRKLTIDPILAQECIQTSYDLAQSGLSEARRSVTALRPLYLEDGDLYNALCQLARQMFAHSPMQLVFNQEGTPYSLLPETEHHLLRIGQEALMNACKYAKATEIQLSLRYEPAQCVLQIKDNGIGFALDSVSDTVGSGFGLLGMTERAERIGAQLTIQSALSQGTEILVWVNQDMGHSGNLS
ncbi:MAG: PAS domain-containing sensor histidine kinase [Drouetiella hepatica Uher 2000/2452]|uniref:PAS domain-containing sensor histidine kinase n=1 Tax=Drouetiella hepatica Uher 2000/2452 TaxID=904376 RepID=A0A951QBQ1_9CYAN|nr:PAS domain-containing sensor histidine kinase [Drouetiella hepatica Uher 2000/2452]